MSRLQLDLPDIQLVELKQLIGESKGTLKTYIDLFNSALTLLKWAIAERKQGRIIASMNEVTGKYKELSMPVLESYGRPWTPEAKTYTPPSFMPASVVMHANKARKGSE